MQRYSKSSIVGAFAALLVYVFITYKIITGIDLNNLGAILLAAFISGFSERYCSEAGR